MAASLTALFSYTDANTLFFIPMLDGATSEGAITEYVEQSFLRHDPNMRARKLW